MTKKHHAESADPRADETNQLQKKVEELTSDLQRTRADFENYRKRMDAERAAARDLGEASAILKLLPVIDNIERAVTHIPDNLKENPWAKGVTGLVKNLEGALAGLNLQRIDAEPGSEFNPDFHDAIQIDEESEGEREVIAEVLQAGYCLRDRPIRHAMVKVKRAQ